MSFKLQRLDPEQNHYFEAVKQSGLNYGVQISFHYADRGLCCLSKHASIKLLAQSLTWTMNVSRSYQLYEGDCLVREKGLASSLEDF